MPSGKRWDKRLRERQVFMQHAAGLTPEEIGRNLRLTPKTVRRLLTRAGVDVAREDVGKRRKEGTKAMGKEWRLDANAWIEEEIERKAKNGDIERRAKRDNISYGDAMVQLAEEIDRPFREIKAKYATKPAAFDEGEIDRRAQSYAEKHGTSYTIALDSVIGTTPGAQRSIQLEETSLPVDDTDAAINRKAEDYARRKGVSFETALEAVLQEEVA